MNFDSFELGRKNFEWVVQLRLIAYAIFLCAIWLLLSGIFKPLIICFGVASVGLVLLITHRMDVVDDDSVSIKINPVKFLGYLFWLLFEIAKSNIAVTKIILSPSMPINQNLFEVPYSQRTDVGQVIFANSITLTPGTVSVETKTGHFLVHAICYTADDMNGLAEMDSRVSATELAGLQ